MKGALIRWPLAAALVVLSYSQVAHAQTWPTRAIKMVVPFAAGGSVDITGRVLAKALSARLGQAVIVENRAGAAGIPGADYVSKAAPDGYTIVLASAGIVAIGPHIYKNMPFDPIKGLLPVTPVVEGINVVVVNTASPVKSLKEFTALAKASPGKINFGSSGVGASDDMATELFANMTGTKMTNIAYKGGGPAIIDLLAGNIDVIFSAVAPAIGQIKAGRLRALAVTSKQRLETLPDVPTVAEAGVPGYESVAWYGLFAPPNTPAAVVRKINTETAAALQNKEVAKQLIESGLVPSSSSPEAFASYVASETEKWGKLVQANGIKVE
jgi:tripartite-type tricarboxylate transporter receptor subunit TctC